MTTSRPILIMAGGTGGHVFPGLAVAEVLQRLGIPVVWLGSRQGGEQRWVPAEGISLHSLSVSGLRGKRWVKLLRAPFDLLRALFEAIAVLRRVRPRCVLGLGGFVAGPGGLAAWLLRYPLLIHEQNRVAGLTNRLLARMARVVMVGFAGTLAERQSVHVGNPVRREIVQLMAAPPDRPQSGDRVRLLVLGGSQGALRLNQVLPKALAAIDPEQRPQLWHQMGPQHVDSGRAAYHAAGVEARIDAFIERMKEAYEWADIVICRAGALTLAELCVAGLGSILVPYPYAVDDHQTRNAEVLAAAGAALLIPQDRLRADALAHTLTGLLADRQRLLQMSAAARSLAKPEAAEQVAQICLREAVA